MLIDTKRKAYSLLALPYLIGIPSCIMYRLGKNIALSQSTNTSELLNDPTWVNLLGWPAQIWSRGYIVFTLMAFIAIVATYNKPLSRAKQAVSLTYILFLLYNLALYHYL